jgi:hypothetical protein
LRQLVGMEIGIRSPFAQPRSDLTSHPRGLSVSSLRRTAVLSVFFGLCHPDIAGNFTPPSYDCRTDIPNPGRQLERHPQLNLKAPGCDEVRPAEG